MSVACNALQRNATGRVVALQPDLKGATRNGNTECGVDGRYCDRCAALLARAAIEAARSGQTSVRLCTDVTMATIRARWADQLEAMGVYAELLLREAMP